MSTIAVDGAQMGPDSVRELSTCGCGRKPLCLFCRAAHVEREAKLGVNLLGGTSGWALRLLAERCTLYRGMADRLGGPAGGTGEMPIVDRCFLMMSFDDGSEIFANFSHVNITKLAGLFAGTTK